MVISKRPRGLFDRPTRELLILLIAGTICFTILATGAAIVAVELFRPSIDTENSKNALRDAVNTLIGLLAGYLAGRTLPDGDDKDDKGAGEKRESGAHRDDSLDDSE